MLCLNAYVCCPNGTKDKETGVFEIIRINKIVKKWKAMSVEFSYPSQLSHDLFVG